MPFFQRDILAGISSLYHLTAKRTKRFSFFVSKAENTAFTLLCANSALVFALVAP
jgi:hypothetical protein